MHCDCARGKQLAFSIPDDWNLEIINMRRFTVCFIHRKSAMSQLCGVAILELTSYLTLL